jgi:putative ABC transport system substrate-binding protein
MNRRCFLRIWALSVAASAAAAPGSLVSRAAEPTQKIARVGVVYPESAASAPRGVSAFWRRLSELGWVEGRNLTIEARWAEGRIDRLPTLMQEVIARRVEVIVTYTTPAALAAKNATKTIPIVVAAMGDPVGTGVAASLARPGGNLTGLSSEIAEDLGGKWLELLQEVVPRLSTVAVISNPDSLFSRKMAEHLKAIAPARGLKLRVIDVGEPSALDDAFKQARRRAQAVLVLPDPLTMHHRWQIASLAAKYRLPDMHGLIDHMDAGALMAYGPDLTALWERAAVYVDKVLRGAKPADLAIEQPTHYLLAVNLKTAKALGLTIPQSILLRADEVLR